MVVGLLLLREQITHSTNALERVQRIMDRPR
jgi:hypothetical protein